jgi:NADPH:quinone reductase-like Zn-dependent oxidoreductase
VAVVREATGGRGADVVLDMVGGDYVGRNLDVLATEGRLLHIAFLHGAVVQLNLLPIMQKRLTLTGSTLRPRTIEEKGRIARALEKRVWPLIERGAVRPVIHARFPLTDAAAAHEALERGDHIGKIVLTVEQG